MTSVRTGPGGPAPGGRQRGLAVLNSLHLIATLLKDALYVGAHVGIVVGQDDARAPLGTGRSGRLRR